ncbi:DUF6404 family protein [Salinivibrio sp. PR932]|uniref:DUF6404 family protein n=1 Tax=Salinivibrio sp. PR932 TaxID=1909492 RepID=UPI001054A13A|nr:DUF6404 family protein [Salinivibrio sp. PR932]
MQTEFVLLCVQVVVDKGPVVQKVEFVQLYLLRMGIPRVLTQTATNPISRLLFPTEKPLVFQSPVSVFFYHGLVLGYVWGAWLWLMFAIVKPGEWTIMTYLIASTFYGVLLGMFRALRVVWAHNRLGRISWEEWCQKHHGLASQDL